jgi:outer membrane protein assembly factor BamB
LKKNAGRASETSLQPGRLAVEFERAFFKRAAWERSILNFPRAVSRVHAGLLILLPAIFLTDVCAGEAPAARGWLSWRGPHQNGTSDEKGLVDKWTPGGENSLWVRDIPGQCAPVIANGKLYIMSFEGAGADLQEGVYCLNAETGEMIWKAVFNDYLSDTIYLRYASASPTIDAETGNVYIQGTQGLMAAFSADGKMLWSLSMMEEYGRLTFPNGRTSSPVISGSLVITSGITTNWGAHGPAGHRFYAFDKKTGELVWASQSTERPRDNSFSTPVLGVYQNRPVFWVGGGDGSVFCINSQTGETVWRYPLSQGGVNTSLLKYNDSIIAIHGSENLNATGKVGCMVAIDPHGALPAKPGETVVLKKDAEVWRNELGAFTASPILVGDRIYEVDETADLQCVDAKTGRVLWTKDLGIEQRTASLLYADGKLYIPVLDGSFYIIRPGEKDCEVLSKQKLEGGCFGSPVVLNGWMYVQTKQKLYCFGSPRAESAPVAEQAPAPVQAGPLAGYVVVPAELFLRPGQTQPLRLIGVDASGNWLPGAVDASKAKWERFIPATAKVKTMLNGEFTADGAFKAAEAVLPSAGAIKAELDGKIGAARGRVIPALPISEDFENTPLQDKEEEPGVKFGYPPLPWIGARLKWEVRERDGSKCLVKTVDNKLMQRAYTFIGHPDMHSYTMQADVMSDGELRKTGGKTKVLKMSEVGLVNQRYAIIIKGAFQQIEINSNMERLQATAPFSCEPKVWYTLKSRVDVDPATGAGVVRGKVWKRGEPEPEKWTIEFQHKTAHRSGSPGFFGFSPTDMPVCVDNISVRANDAGK